MVKSLLFQAVGSITIKAMSPRGFTVTLNKPRQFSGAFLLLSKIMITTAKGVTKVSG